MVECFMTGLDGVTTKIDTPEPGRWGNAAQPTPAEAARCRSAP